MPPRLVVCFSAGVCSNLQGNGITLITKGMFQGLDSLENLYVHLSCSQNELQAWCWCGGVDLSDLARAAQHRVADCLCQRATTNFFPRLVVCFSAGVCSNLNGNGMTFLAKDTFEGLTLTGVNPILYVGTLCFIALVTGQKGRRVCMQCD